MRSARWQFVDPSGTVHLPYGTKEYAARYLAWLLDLDEADVFSKLVRVELLGRTPAIVKCGRRDQLNTGAPLSRAISSEDVAIRLGTTPDRKAGGAA